MKPWAKWTLLILWILLLVFTSLYWNPFVSLPALLKYSVFSVFSYTVFGAVVLIAEFYVLTSIIFPLPPRADAKAPKGFWRRSAPFLFKKSGINPKAPSTLDDLIGNAAAKVEIKEVIEILANSERYAGTGANIPKGMLFVGPPGVGKTLFARAIANEVGVPFYVAEGSGFSGLFFGLGVIKLKTLFRKLRGHQRAILFIDEIDSLAARRQSDRGFGAQSDMNMTLNTLLTEIDGFSGSNTLIIGATNNDGALDPALLRSGRMDRRIYFQLPSPEERKQLFEYYLNKVASDKDIDLEEISKLTVNYSPAEIASVVNEASLLSSRPEAPGKVNTQTIVTALDRMSVGLERSLVGSGVELATTDASIRLSDVIGIDEVKQDVQEVVNFLQHGEDLRKIGARIPRGLLFIGPPGVGKTMLAKAIATEAGVPFYGMSASQFQTAFAGEGPGRIRAVYAQARKSPAAIVFIDEIDAIGGTMTEQGSVRNNLLNQLLIELDGIQHSNVITIGATNAEQNLDPAFIRSGRFDRKCYVGLPDAEARKKIFAKYLSDIKVAVSQDLDKLAKQTMNFSGADIAATVNEAAIIAVRRGKSLVEKSDLEEAVDRVSVMAGHKLNTHGMNLGRVPDIDVQLDDIKGMEEAKAEAAEVVSLLKNSDKIRDTGLKSPRGVLLVGRPGTGKTMLAKAIANEAGVPFYALSGGDFQSMWAGVGSNRVRAVYEQARRSGKPAIVFIDEIDALGGKRSIDLGGGAIQDANKTLNQFLVELDGFGKHKVLTIGATNNQEMLDPALLRPGRFDRRIDVPLPNLEGRIAIINHYLKRTKMDTTANTHEIARMTVFSSGADLANIVNEAGLTAVKEGRSEVSQEDLFKAIQRVQFGVSYHRQVLVEELKATAYHEAGHAIVCYFRNRRDRIQVVTIIPSGYALGYVWPVAKEEYVQKNKHEYITDIEVSLGGYAAENLYMETTTSGVSTDLTNVAQIASQMIREWGMGPWKFNTNVAYAYNDQYKNTSSAETGREIELNIKYIVDTCLQSVEGLLHSKRAQLDVLAHKLMEKETLYYRDLVAILEPERAPDDVEKEMMKLAERKLVGKPPVIEIL